ncbi:unnamed protein product [Chondrus crispus]|uniref:Uncharacterized protein n=1 Tax=Chondrus crispus TaxID=2769 RepID=R7QEJ3_CHOCR|nr:unnamed protein product [Chondrus crispus]CDF35876.1 unnamed protein product [Chondrus crispus]|eukprot:XP_005715695.1 unnamed protein product [Chondrus crispus]
MGDEKQGVGAEIEGGVGRRIVGRLAKRETHGKRTAGTRPVVQCAALCRVRQILSQILYCRPMHWRPHRGVHVPHTGVYFGNTMTSSYITLFLFPLKIEVRTPTYTRVLYSEDCSSLLLLAPPCSSLLLLSMLLQLARPSPLLLSFAPLLCSSPLLLSFAPLACKLSWTMQSASAIHACPSTQTASDREEQPALAEGYCTNFEEK